MANRSGDAAVEAFTCSPIRRCTKTVTIPISKSLCLASLASVILASKQDVLVVPNTAIRTVSGQRGVQVLKDGETVDTPVTFGLSNDTQTEAVSGLKEGDVIVIPQARATTSAQPNRQGGGGPGGVIIGR